MDFSTRKEPFVRMLPQSSTTKAITGLFFRPLSFSAWEYFYLLVRQTSYPMGAGGKAAGVRSWPRTYI
jgi:hypothetical protein